MKPIRIPRKVLRPIEQFLKKKEAFFLRRKRDLAAEDPFNDPDRNIDQAAHDVEANDRVNHDRVRVVRLEVDKALVRVRKSLTKIKLGKYGVCDDCKKMINTERLAVDPVAIYCVACKKKRDRKNNAS